MLRSNIKPPAGINGNDTITFNRLVTLTITATGATEMIIGHWSDFTGSTWEPYAATKNLYLTNGYETKGLYIIFRNGYGAESARLCDDIIYAAYSPDYYTALIVNGATVTGNISSQGESDWYRFIATVSGTYIIETWAGTLTDNYMSLYGPNSTTTLLEGDDDNGTGNAAMITKVLSAGTYYLSIRAYSSTGTGTYTINVKY